MHMNIETIPSCPIVYIRRIGAYGLGNAQTMEQLKTWAKINNLMDNELVILGIAYDDPQTTPPENCRYDACILLDGQSITQNAPVQHGIIDGGKYAIFTIEHTPLALEQAWLEIFPIPQRPPS